MAPSTLVTGLLARPSRWQRRIEQLDPETDFVEIYRLLTLYEFPWDLNQSLSLALFRTYAVPSIGRLLDETGQFTGACQRRYDDTAVLLEAPLVDGFDSTAGRTAVRRINQMHRLYDISDEDLRYVLATFVVVPRRWLAEHGWRDLSAAEERATVLYYRELARRMAIPDVPETYAAFATLMDDYEAQHFAPDPGSRRVADATLALMVGFYPRPAAAVVERFSRALMDPPLLAAFGYDDPGPLMRRVARGGLAARARVVAAMPARRRPRLVGATPRIRDATTPLAERGTFAAGCPAPAPAPAPGPPRGGAGPGPARLRR